jgi:hypothetical protein
MQLFGRRGNRWEVGVSAINLSYNAQTRGRERLDWDLWITPCETPVTSPQTRAGVANVTRTSREQSPTPFLDRAGHKCGIPTARQSGDTRPQSDARVSWDKAPEQTFGEYCAMPSPLYRAIPRTRPQTADYSPGVLHPDCDYRHIVGLFSLSGESVSRFY